jgi:hypothetical protein
VLHAIHDRIVDTGREIVSVRLTPSAHAHGLALRCPPRLLWRARLGLSHSTVKHHLVNARSRVGATTMAQLVWIVAPRLPEAEGTSSTDE